MNQTLIGAYVPGELARALEVEARRRMTSKSALLREYVARGLGLSHLLPENQTTVAAAAERPRQPAEARP